MDAKEVQRFLRNMSSYFKSERMYDIEKKLEAMSEEDFRRLCRKNFVSPQANFWISFFIGNLCIQWWRLRGMPSSSGGVVFTLFRYLLLVFALFPQIATLFGNPNFSHESDFIQIYICTGLLTICYLIDLFIIKSKTKDYNYELIDYESIDDVIDGLIDEEEPDSSLTEVHTDDNSLETKLKQLKSMLDSGLISEKDYQDKKNNLLSKF